MTANDFDAFSALLADVMAFYRRDAGSFALEVWWQACRGYSLASLRSAFSAHARDPEHGAFAPMPADIVRHLEGTGGDRALRAWHQVLRAMQAVGHYASVDFGDAFTHAAIIDCGGWPALCCTRTAELDFVRRRFCESYRAWLAAGTVPEDTPRRLAGEHELHNAALGFTVPDEADALEGYLAHQAVTRLS